MFSGFSLLFNEDTMPLGHNNPNDSLDRPRHKVARTSGPQRRTMSGSLPLIIVRVTRTRARNYASTARNDVLASCNVPYFNVT